jgi:transcriptional regulator with XRE-family HTH domain
MRSQHISDRIRAARLAAGLTQAQLAAALGTHQSVVSGWERGLTPRVERLAQIAVVLGVTVDALVVGQGCRTCPHCGHATAAGPAGGIVCDECGWHHRDHRDTTRQAPLYGAIGGPMGACDR